MVTGVWSEERLIQAVNETGQFFAIPYGPSSTAPEDDVREFELYFERWMFYERSRMDSLDSKLPASGAAREALRQKGQFWTPDWVAEAMVAYVLGDKGGSLFDPAVGAGAFFRAAKKVAQEQRFHVTLSGMDIDAAVLKRAVEQGLIEDEVANVTVGDFVFAPPERKLAAIVANPPYIRHHRIPATQKVQLKHLSMQITGNTIDGRAGLHIYFLIRALSLLEDQGRLAFIMPADTCEGKFAHKLWQWITSQYALEAVVAFAPDASPFPNVDTNPLIFFIRNALPTSRFVWARCRKAATDVLKTWVCSGFTLLETDALSIVERDIAEGIAIGLSRPPVIGNTGKYVLGDFVHVMRGIATGANDFFLLTDEQAAALAIPDSYFVRAVGRTRDVPGDEVTEETLAALKEKGRPTQLLSLKDDSVETYPETLQDYLKRGEAAGLPRRPLISQRRPWYKMETRTIPPLLFAYLGRRNARFIRNTAQVVPLTGFLCVYPKSSEPGYFERVWKIVSHPQTIANLHLIGKSYGDGAIKVEPRNLERLPIPDSVIAQIGAPVQMRLFEESALYDTTAHPGGAEREVA